MCKVADLLRDAAEQAERGDLPRVQSLLSEAVTELGRENKERERRIARADGLVWADDAEDGFCEHCPCNGERCIMGHQHGVIA